MRSIEQIIEDNGGDNTPALDTHNLTGRASGVVALSYEEPRDYAPLATLDDSLPWDDEHINGWYIGSECG